VVEVWCSLETSLMFLDFFLSCILEQRTGTFQITIPLGTPSPRIDQASYEYASIQPLNSSYHCYRGRSVVPRTAMPRLDDQEISHLEPSSVMAYADLVLFQGVSSITMIVLPGVDPDPAPIRES
jgi:hypothetical protein